MCARASRVAPPPPYGGLGSSRVWVDLLMRWQEDQIKEWKNSSYRDFSLPTNGLLSVKEAMRNRIKWKGHYYVRTYCGILIEMKVPLEMESSYSVLSLCFSRAIPRHLNIPLQGILSFNIFIHMSFRLCEWILSRVRNWMIQKTLLLCSQNILSRQWRSSW